MPSGGGPPFSALRATTPRNQASDCELVSSQSSSSRPSSPSVRADRLGLREGAHRSLLRPRHREVRGTARTLEDVVEQEYAAGRQDARDLRVEAALVRDVHLHVLGPDDVERGVLEGELERARATGTPPAPADRRAPPAPSRRARTPRSGRLRPLDSRAPRRGGEPSRPDPSRGRARANPAPGPRARRARASPRVRERGTRRRARGPRARGTRGRAPGPPGRRGWTGGWNRRCSGSRWRRSRAWLDPPW